MDRFEWLYVHGGSHGGLYYAYEHVLAFSAGDLDLKKNPKVYTDEGDITQL